MHCNVQNYDSVHAIILPSLKLELAQCERYWDNEPSSHSAVRLIVVHHQVAGLAHLSLFVLISQYDMTC